MPAFAIVLIVVAAVAIALALSYFRVGRSTAQFGEQDQAAMYRDEEAELDEKPSGDEPEPPLPRRSARAGV